MRRRSMFALIVLGIGGLAAAPYVGGWTITTVHDLPTHLVVGEPTTITFTMRQHGEDLVTGVSPALLVKSEGDGLLTPRRRIAATSAGRGVYRAVVTPDAARPLSIGIDTDLHGWKTTLLEIPVLARGASAPKVPAVTHGRALFVAKGCAGCHMKADDPRLGETQVVSVGPSLTNRTYPADYVAKKILDPSSLPAITNYNTNAKMPKLEVTTAEADAIAAYLNGRAMAQRRP